ncbi:helix-turn-helix domain-containing protein [Streptomyces virginiae]|uniref:helix-turn-helix domain-containing protein n=1 Tax=Streptomyces virginiae TaxID=1961 RepID=UPI0022519673|nr:helix-turn-helix domain-containing protein [Streptomyces virginiae]
MALGNPSAPPRVPCPDRAATPRSGVVHVNTRHASHYTVVGNHLLQHQTLSATAIGIAAYIQSLPEGTPIGIKVLAARFPEGEIRIGSALRELETHGYLERRRERLATGRVVTRTYSYNKPGSTASTETRLPPPPPPPDRAPAPEPQPESEPQPEPEPAAPPAAASAPDPGALELLAGLRRHDPRLLLSERDVRRLAPDVSAWLERGVTPDAVARALSADLPAQMRRPASVLAYRLTALLPPHLPPAPPPPATRDIRRPDPLQNCTGCDRAFRAPRPGRCRYCPPEEGAAA